jgi:WD40 repeat protein
MEELCYSDADQNTILTLSNRDSQVIWKLTYRDYVQSAENFPDGTLAVVHWTLDGQYAYFASFTGGDGGECFVGGLDSGRGLFRFDSQTGNTTAILSPFDDFGWYGFSFSPTDRRLVYGARSRDLRFLDITTGQLINIASVNSFDQSGGYIWLPDGLRLVYSTVLGIDNGENLEYTLRLADAQTGSEQILLESPKNCFNVRSWSDSNILTIESYDKDYNQTLVEYDLNSSKIISEATVTP